MKSLIADVVVLLAVAGLVRGVWGKRGGECPARRRPSFTPHASEHLTPPPPQPPTATEATPTAPALSKAATGKPRRVGARRTRAKPKPARKTKRKGRSGR